MLRTFLLLVLTLSLFSCRQRSTQVPKELPVDFQVFYELFHRDSSYQMEHIVFPLEGLPDYANTETWEGKPFVWLEDNWEMHRPWKGSEEFRQEWAILAEGMIRERLIHTSRPIMTERRFAKMGDDWFLIYYAGLNTYHQVQDQK